MCDPTIDAVAGEVECLAGTRSPRPGQHLSKRTCFGHRKCAATRAGDGKVGSALDRITSRAEHAIH